MGSPRTMLPPIEQVHAAYLQPGASFRTVAALFSCSAGTVRSRLRDWAERTGQPWPLKPDDRIRRPTKDTVTAQLVISEVHYATRRLRVSQTEIARVAGMKSNHLHKITSGHTERIMRTTQGKILEAITKIERDEVKVTRGPVILPMDVRDRCPNDHPYTGRRDPRTGCRACSVCKAEKTRRNDTKRAGVPRNHTRRTA